MVLFFAGTSVECLKGFGVLLCGLNSGSGPGEFMTEA